MKQVFHKIMSIVMAFVVLFSTMSFTLNMHYCGENLVETTLFNKAKGCGMEMQKPSFEGCSITKKNCCNDKQLVIEGQQDLKQSFDSISFEQQVFFTSFVYAYINLFQELDKEKTPFQEYIPPLVIKQIFKIDETYLI